MEYIDDHFWNSAFDGDLEMVKSLSKKGANINFEKDGGVLTPLIAAADRGHLEVVKYLVEECGCDINMTTKYKYTALMAASGNGHIKVVKYLIENGALINSIDRYYHRTALMYAASHPHNRHKGHLEVAKYLVKEGMSKEVIDRRDKDGNTALMLAVLCNCIKMVKCLTSLGADIKICNRGGYDRADRYGQTPLVCASQKGYKEIEEYLFEQEKITLELAA